MSDDIWTTVTLNYWTAKVDNITLHLRRNYPNDNPRYFELDQIKSVGYEKYKSLYSAFTVNTVNCAKRRAIESVTK